MKVSPSGLVVRNSVELATADSTVGILKSLDVVAGAVVLSTDTAIAKFGIAPDNYVSLVWVLYYFSLTCVAGGTQLE